MKNISFSLFTLSLKHFLALQSLHPSLAFDSVFKDRIVAICLILINPPFLIKYAFNVTYKVVVQLSDHNRKIAVAHFLNNMHVKQLKKIELAYHMIIVMAINWHWLINNC